MSAKIAKDKAGGPVVLALDVGTSAVKILLFDKTGREVEGLKWRKPFEIRRAVDGASEADPDALIRTVCEGIDGVLSRAGRLRKAIVAVACCTFAGNILGVNRRGRPLTPVFTYADTRAENEVQWLRAEFDARAVYDRTGCPFHSSYLPARLRWLSISQPDLFRRVERWLSIGEYLALTLFGKAFASYSMASWSGLLDRHRLVWDDFLLEKLALDTGRLAPLVDCDCPQKGLRREFALRWPALADAPWFPAIGDGAAANIGSGCTGASRVAITMGSTAAVRATVETAIDHVPDGLWCYRIDKRRSLPGGATSEGGNLCAWMTDVLKLGRLSSLEKDLAALKPDGHGLTVLPFVAGERSPGWHARAKATVHGLSLASSALEILRAGMEAVAYRVALVFDRLADLLPADLEIVAGGGALQNSPAWLQMVADVLGRQIAVTGTGETSARGAALLAFEALGMIADLSATPNFTAATYRPDSGRHLVYRSALERQQALYQKLIAEDPLKG